MNCIIASTSTVYGSGYLEYLLEPLENLFSSTFEVLFIPYARPQGITHDQYTEKAREAFTSIGKKVVGIHEKQDPIKAIENAKAIFTGGGNTFLLVKQLHEKELMEPLKKALLSGTSYLGTSAGSNICGLTMQTTNDMPIIMPPSFKTLGVIPFNINAHYIEPESGSKHMGESRATRIEEFHVLNDMPVVGLPEGSWVELKDGETTLRGKLPAKIFKKGEQAYEVQPDGGLKNLT